MRMYQATPTLWLPEGVTTDTMYKGDAMMDQMIEICGVDGLFDETEPDQVEQDRAAAQELAALRQTHWQMRDGSFIAVSDMTDAHVVNTIRYLRRLYGEQLDEEVQDFEECDIVPTFPALLAEAEKRGLQL